MHYHMSNWAENLIYLAIIQTLNRAGVRLGYLVCSGTCKGVFSVILLQNYALK
jgi:hypothetical protein